MHRRRLLRVRRAAVLDAPGSRQREVAASRGLARQHEPAVRLQRQIARLRRDRTGVAHPDAVLVRCKKDPVAIHTAQLAHVDRNRRSRAVAGNRCRGERVVIDLARAGDHIQILRVDRRVHLHRAGDEVHLVDIGGIQARAGNRHEPAADVVASERAIGTVVRHARCEGCATGVDEGRAIKINARRIRKNELCPGAGDLQSAPNLGGVRAIDLVDDDPCGLACTVIRVAVDPARLLGLDHRGRVVQDRAGLLYIELIVGVDRDAGARRRGHVDLRQAVRRLDHVRAGTRRRDDLRVGQSRQHAERCDTRHNDADTGRRRSPPCTCFARRRFPLGGRRLRDGHHHTPKPGIHQAMRILVHSYRRGPRPFIWSLTASLLKRRRMTVKNCQAVEGESQISNSRRV
ncbi:hypothetical protein BCO71171_06602 [Burkholderia contaminans]|uniref:Uncharacterized protein n=1 Tax=Burkholderia contaminans TaxID=488447 RepID=A0A6P3BYL9_9BURK|nr:hypothetical protein BCO71171_06602 [Burkholderia contaminans]